MILGLDMATKKTGYGILGKEGSLVSFGLIKTDSNSVLERIKKIFQEIEKLILENEIEIVVLEDVPVSTHNNLKTGKDLCILQGVVLSICFKRNIPFKLYSPSSWRSIVGTYDGTRQGMKRDFQKQEAVKKINDLYNLGFVYNKTETKSKKTDDDIAEAICIALAYIKDVFNTM